MGSLSYEFAVFYLFLPDFCPQDKNLEEKMVTYLAAAGESSR
jgi:hypothetical protein